MERTTLFDAENAIQRHMNTLAERVGGPDEPEMEEFFRCYEVLAQVRTAIAAEGSAKTLDAIRRLGLPMEHVGR